MNFETRQLPLLAILTTILYGGLGSGRIATPIVQEAQLSGRVPYFDFALPQLNRDIGVTSLHSRTLFILGYPESDNY